MCLAVPGTIRSISGDTQLSRTGMVDFGGVQREINLAYVNEAQVGDWVLVHAGFAISQIDEEEAQEVLRLLDEMMSAGGEGAAER